MFKANEILINIYHPINKVTFIKVNPNNDRLFVGVDELGLYSENWVLRDYMSESAYREV